MAHEAERAACAALTSICGEPLPTPGWLQRPGKTECGPRWKLVCKIYQALTSKQLPDVMPSRERREVDGVYRYKGRDFLFELDEKQHFNEFRAATLRCYPTDLPLAFDRKAWLTSCVAKQTLERGGFAAPKPPLFPDPGGRHRQRAFRDALADVLPPVHGYLPTLRLDDQQVKSWMKEGTVKSSLVNALHAAFAGSLTKPRGRP
jgi:hypothetical protein